MHFDPAAPSHYAMADPRALRPHIARALGPFSGGMTSDNRARSSMRYAPLGKHMALVELHHDKAISLDLAPRAQQSIITILQRGHIDLPGRNERIGPGRGLVITPNSATQRLCLSDDVSLIAVRRDEPLDCDGDRLAIASNALDDGFVHIAIQALNVAMANPSQFSRPSVQQAWTTALSAVLSETIGKAHQPKHERQSRQLPLPYYVVRARNFILQDLSRPMTTADVVAASGVSRRTLYRGFQQAFGQPISSYIKDRRLDTAHEVLRHASNSRLRIIDVANACGFSHPGQFAAAYKARFKETPKQTRALSGLL